MRVSREPPDDRANAECPARPFRAQAHEGSAAPAKQPVAEAELQARYRAEYLRQLRRQTCPGCGEAAQRRSYARA